MPAASDKLHVNGSVAGVGAYIALSDRNFKRNIAAVPNALAKVQNLRGVSFDWDQAAHPELDLGTRRELGVIAQEVEAVFPEAVTTDDRGVKSVAYSMLLSPLIEALKELTARWSADSGRLHSEVRELRDENDRMRTELDAMKKENAEIKDLMKDLRRRLEN